MLDTHAVIWWIELDPRLSRRAVDFISDDTTEVILSAVVPWEISIKRALGKLDAPRDLVESFLGEGATPLHVNFAHAAAVEHLPLHHGDPFDRLLLAQATVEDAAIVSGDPSFARYDVPIVW